VTLLPFGTRLVDIYGYLRAHDGAESTSRATVTLIKAGHPDAANILLIGQPDMPLWTGPYTEPAPLAPLGIDNDLAL
jgi:hypothetical protein